MKTPHELTALDRAKAFFAKGKVTAELRGPTRPVLRNSLLCMVGIAMAATLGAAHFMADYQAKAPASQQDLTALQHGVAVAGAIPAPWNRKLTRLSFEAGQENAADRAYSFGTTPTRCKVTFDAKESNLHKDSFPLNGLTAEQKAEFLMLHEVGHCYSGMNGDRERADYTPPSGYVQIASTKIVLPYMVNTMVAEAEADASAVLWFAKIHPEMKDSIAEIVKGSRLVEHEAAAGQGGTNDHYTVAALDYLALRLTRMSDQELASLNADSILSLAEKAAMQTAQHYKQAIVPFSLNIAGKTPDALKVYVVVTQGGQESRELISNLSGQLATAGAFKVPVDELSGIVAAAEAPEPLTANVKNRSGR